MIERRRDLLLKERFLFFGGGGGKNPGGIAALGGGDEVEEAEKISCAGRSGATTVCPADRSRGATRCQYDARPPAPGTSTNVLIRTRRRRCR